MSSTDYGDMKNPRGIIGYFASNLVAANLIMSLLLVGGLFAGLSLNSQIFPSVDPGIISVSVPYPGATPTEVEEGIHGGQKKLYLGSKVLSVLYQRPARILGH